MKKAYIQPEFDLLKLSTSEDILSSIDEVETGNNEKFDPDDSGLNNDWDSGEGWD